MLYIHLYPSICSAFIFYVLHLCYILNLDIIYPSICYILHLYVPGAGLGFAAVPLSLSLFPSLSLSFSHNCSLLMIMHFRSTISGAISQICSPYMYGLW